MPGQEVDRAAFAEHRIRHLRLDHPTERLEIAGYRFRECGVAAVEQAIDVAAPPANEDDQLGIEDGEQVAQAPERHAIQPAALDPGDAILAPAPTSADLGLSEVEAVTERPGDPTDSKVIHHRQS